MYNSDSAVKVESKPLVMETFAALKHHNYRLYFFGQLISGMGSWMQSTAQGYLVYQLTKSTTYLGLVVFMGGVATWIFTLFGGMVADRIPRRTLIIITQASMMILAFIQAILTFMNIIQPWHILVLALLLGVVTAFDVPARVSFALELVPREDITNAIALNSTLWNIAIVVGPSLAGFTYALFGPAWCFMINGISFIAVIIAALLMHTTKNKKPVHNSKPFADITEGLRYILSSRLILSLIGAVSLVNIFGAGVLNLLPAWATDILHGNELTNGLLVAARGFGALISSLMLASLIKFKIRGKLWITGFLVLPIALFIFALVRWVPLSLAVIVVIGWSLMMVTNNSSAMIHSEIPDALRGRVVAVLVLSFNGMIPFGALLAGLVAQQVGTPVTAIFSAAILLVFSLVAWVCFPDIRQQV